jgi:hypothetical protein
MREEIKRREGWGRGGVVTGSDWVTGSDGL